MNWWRKKETDLVLVSNYAFPFKTRIGDNKIDIFIEQFDKLKIIKR